MATLTGNTTAEDKKYNRIIIAIGIIIPIAVAVLLFAPNKMLQATDWVKALPELNAVINSMTTLLLLGALVAIRKKKIGLHKSLMTTAFVLGAIFLVSYIIYHASVPSVKFGDVNGDGTLSSDEMMTIGSMRYVYLFVLLSHILLSIVVVPFVLYAFYYSLTGKFEKHRKIVKYTFPIWLYVSVTGVITFFMISPYYH